MKLPVFELIPGDLIDLEGDPFADPNRDHDAYVYEYAQVAYVERETERCIAVGIESGPEIGFPVGHLINVVESSPDDPAR